jgi:tyrosinase
MSPTAPASPQQPTVTLRHRRSAIALQDDQLAAFRQAITTAQAIADDRGYQYYAGIHGLPLPIYCKHGSPFFLPWHRAYLYFFERALQDLVPGVTLPWWDWTAEHDVGAPRSYGDEQVGGQPNPLYSSPIQASGREPGGPDHTTREPGAAGAPPLPEPAQIQALLQLPKFIEFQEQLEDLHNAVHMWVGGTMGNIPTAAYDPLFWAHHTMIDRLWALWQQAHAGAGPPANLLGEALPPFAMTVTQTLATDALGYDYAVATTAAPGPLGPPHG